MLLGLPDRRRVSKLRRAPPGSASRAKLLVIANLVALVFSA
jgi:hypothetical protein